MFAPCNFLVLVLVEVQKSLLRIWSRGRFPSQVCGLCSSWWHYVSILLQGPRGVIRPQSWPCLQQIRLICLRARIGRDINSLFWRSQWGEVALCSGPHNERWESWLRRKKGIYQNVNGHLSIQQPGREQLGREQLSFSYLSGTGLCLTTPSLQQTRLIILY